jgi:hypothetical protein
MARNVSLIWNYCKSRQSDERFSENCFASLRTHEDLVHRLLHVFARKCLPFCQNVIASTAFSQLVTPPERFLRGIDEFATTLFAWGLCRCSDVMNQVANHVTSLPSQLGG